MNINIDRDGTLEGLHDAIERVLEEEGVKSIIIFSCDGNDLDPEGVDSLLKGLPVSVCGGIFPAVVFEKEKLTSGSVVVGLTCETVVKTIPNISDEDADHAELIDEKFPEIEHVSTMLVFVDGFAKRIESFIGDLFTVFGLQPNYIGGGAGSLSMQQKPCLFTNQGMVMDAAVLTLLDMKSGIGVSHEWRSVDGPFRVTESHRNVVTSIDWPPAFEVYRAVVDRHGGIPIDEENFSDVAKAYPFGMARLEGERVVRDPIHVNPDKSMVFVGEVSEGTHIDILNGDAGSLIDAAGRAARLAQEALPEGSRGEFGFFIDCISRVLFLEERFEEELEAVFMEGTPMVGACSIGEIANSGKDFLEFYNKTAVVAILEDN